MGRLSVGLLLLALIVACGRNGSDGVEPRYQSSAPDLDKVYFFVVDLPHNSLLLLDTYGPLIDYLNRNVQSASFQLKISPNCDEFDMELDGGQLDFALANLQQTLKSLRHGYHVIAKMADDREYTGVILLRRNSGIRQITDLKGKKVAYPCQSCLLGAVMPQYYFQIHGLDVNRDIDNVYVGSHESAIMNVYLGNVVAAGVKRPAWELFRQVHPDQARELAARWETEPLISPAVVARDEVPPRIVTRVAQLLDTLHTSEEGRAILARIPLSRFELADDSRYREFEVLLHRVEQTLHPLKVRQP